MSEQTLIQFRADKELKNEVSRICESLGFDLPTAFRMFMNQVRINRGLPFGVTLPEKDDSVEDIMAVFDSMCANASDVGEMTIDEINAEIAEVRREMKVRR